MQGKSCVRWKSVIGRAVMAQREGWNNAFVREEFSAHEWISQKTYKPPKRKKPVRDTHGTFQHLNSPAYAQPEFPTQGRWLLQSSFFSCLRTRQKLDFLRIQQKSPIGGAVREPKSLLLAHHKTKSWIFSNISEKSPRNKAILARISWIICDDA